MIQDSILPPPGGYEADSAQIFEAITRKGVS